MKRRNFIRDAVYAGATVPFARIPLEWDKWRLTERVTILHTNDIHSRIDPFPMDGSRNQGLGGAAKRSALINAVRGKEEHVLLLDSGDIFQGTPYFNVFKGEIEMKLMSKMNYDAATLGNHDFDNGIDGLEAQLKNASFPFVVSNYDMSDTVMAGKTKPYQTFQKGDIKIGVYGLGIELEGLVPQTLYKNTRYLSPLDKALKYENILRNELACDLVICISHLGFKYRDNKISDTVLAHETMDTDIILGGHTHTFMNEPVLEKNKNGDPVLINQVGFAGILIGRLDVYFEKKKKKQIIRKDNIVVR